MRITPAPLEIGELDGFKADTLGRLQFGEGLSHLLGNVDQPLVLAIDGKWGSGKSTFLRMWAGHLRKAGYPVIEFDAFSHDYHQDAFLAIASELVEISRQAGDDVKDRVLKKAADVAKVILRGAARLTTKVATLSLAKGDEPEKILEAISDDLADVTDDSLKEILTSQRKAKSTFAAFRAALAELPGALGAGMGEARPLVIIVDELDRCRPEFALELIESIKHFFSVPQVHFVLGAHLDQLENSVRARYGSNIDARNYLQKFIHISAVLPVEDRTVSRGTATRYAEQVFQSLGVPPRLHDAMDWGSSVVGQIAHHNRLSLRDIERLVSALYVALTYSGGEHPTAYIVGLTVMRLLHPSLYEKARRGSLIYDDIVEPLALGREADFNVEHVQNLWKFATLTPFDDVHGLAILKRDLGQPEVLLPKICRAVIEPFYAPR